MPASRISERIAAALSDLGEARALVAVLCAHLLALSEEREVKVSLSSPERDMIARAAVVSDEEARRITEGVRHDEVIAAARKYLAHRFQGTTLAEKYPAAGLGLFDVEVLALSYTLMYREAFLAVLEGRGGSSADEVRCRELPVRISHPAALLFAFPKTNADRLCGRFIDSFTLEQEPLRLVISKGASIEESYASILGAFALIADRQSNRFAALSAALLRHLSSEFARVPEGASRILRSAIRDALIAFSDTETHDSSVSVPKEIQTLIDAVIAVALRESDFIGAARTVTSLSGSNPTCEEVRDAAKALIIPEEAKRTLLHFLDNSAT